MSDCTELIPIYDQRCLTINAPGHDCSYDTDNTQTAHQKDTKNYFGRQVHVYNCCPMAR